MYVSFIFHSPDMPRTSPVVNVWWERPALELLRLVRSRIHADLPEEACAQFIGACAGRPEVDLYRITVHNLPYPPEWRAETDDRFAWFRLLMADIRGWDRPPMLINLDPPYHITLAGSVVGNWLSRET